MLKNEIFTENASYQLLFLTEDNRSNYIRTLAANSTYRINYDNAEYRESAWKTAQAESTRIFCIFEKSTGAYCGYCNLMDLSSHTPEIGISLLPEFQGSGIGKNALLLMMKAFKVGHNVDYFIARVYSDNVRSLRLMKKLNAVQFQTMDSEFKQTMKILYKDMTEEELKEVYRKHNIPYDDRYIICFKIIP